MSPAGPQRGPIPPIFAWSTVHGCACVSRRSTSIIGHGPPWRSTPRASQPDSETIPQLDTLPRPARIESGTLRNSASVPSGRTAKIVVPGSDPSSRRMKIDTYLETTDVLGRAVGTGPGVRGGWTTSGAGGLTLAAPKYATGTRNAAANPRTRKRRRREAFRARAPRPRGRIATFTISATGFGSVTGAT